MSTGMEQRVEKQDTQQRNHLRATLMTSPEGRILLSGVAVAMAYSLWLGAKVLFSPWDAQILIGVTATAVLFGRAAGLAFGYSVGLTHTTVIMICMVVETVFVLIFYPLFVFSWRHLVVFRRLGKTLEQIREAAERHQSTIQKYGLIGLFAFVWFPFWMTGPVVGSAIGFLIGMRARLTLPIVLGGTYVAIFTWAAFMRYFHERAAAYSTYAPMILVGVLILIGLAGNWLQRTARNNRHRKRRR
jgi:uncharacterized membrane protein